MARSVAIEHLYERHRIAVVFTAAAILAFGALSGLAWSAGFVAVYHRFIHVHWIWIPVALGAEIASYIGYVLSYREVARAEDGAELDLTGTAAVVATGFGVFVAS